MGITAFRARVDALINVSGRQQCTKGRHVGVIGEKNPFALVRKKVMFARADEWRGVN